MAQSWRQYTRDWKQTARIAAWLLLGPALSILEILVRLLLSQVSNNGTAQILFAIAHGILSFVISIFSVVIALTVIIRLYQFVQKRDYSAAEKAGPWPWHLFWPFIWIGILRSLIMLIPLVVGLIVGGLLMPSISAFAGGRVALAVGIGLLIAFLPMIYLGIRFGFSEQVLFENGDRGTKALHHSGRLVQNRWWASFWRLLLSGLVYSLITGLIVCAFITLVAAIAYLLFPGQIANIWQNPVMLVIAVLFLSLIPSAVQIFFMPYMVTVQVKLFHALKKTA